MFCKFCKQSLPEDNSICDNKICEYINEKLKVSWVIPILSNNKFFI